MNPSNRGTRKAAAPRKRRMTTVPPTAEYPIADALGRLLMLIDEGILHPPTPESKEVARRTLEEIEQALGQLPGPGKPGDAALAAFFQGRAESRARLIEAGVLDGELPTMKWHQRAEWALAPRGKGK